MTRFTPEEVEAKYGLTPGAVPRLRRAARRPERQPAEHPERGGEDRGQVGPRVRLARRAGRPGRRGQGQGRRGAARAPGRRCCSNRRLTELRPRRAARRSGPADLAVQPWDRDEVHKLFDNLQFRVLRERLFATLTSGRARGRGRLRGRRGRRARPGERARAGCRRTPAPAATGLIFRGTWGRGTGELTGIALAAADDHAAFVDVGPDLDAADEQALAAWLADPTDPKACTRSRARCSRSGPRGWELRRRRQRHRAGRLPGAAGPAVVRPGRPRPALPASASCKDAAEPEGQLTLDGLGPSEADVAAEADARRRPQGRRGQRPRRRARDRARPARRRRRCWATSSCR